MNYKESGYGIDLDLLRLFRNNYVVHILGEVGNSEKNGL